MIISTPQVQGRVLFVDQTSALGGAELSLLDIVKQRGAKDRVLLFQRGELADILDRLHVEIVVGSHSTEQTQVRKNSGIWGMLGATGYLRRHVRLVCEAAKGCDIIYANTPKAFIVSAISAIRTRKPIIYHLRDIVSADHFSWVNRRALVAFARLSNAHIIANSLATAKAFIKAGADERRISVVYNGIDCKPFEDAIEKSKSCRDQILSELRHIVTPADKLIGVFGRLSRWKGQDVALRALSKVPNAHMLVIGTALFGEDKYVEELNRLVLNLNLADRVHFLGFRRDVATVMQASDVIVHCSSSPEPFGRVIVESMLSKKPIVAARAGGALEILEDWKTGLLFEPGSADDLSRCITELLDPSKSVSMVQRAYREALQRFSVEERVADINQIIATLIAPRRRIPILPLRPETAGDVCALFVDQTAQLGGAELCMLDIIRERRQKKIGNRHDKVILLETGKLEEILRGDGIEVDVASLSVAVRSHHKESGLWRKLFIAADVFQLAKIVARKSKGADLIVANTPKALVVACLASLLCRKRVVYHLHDILSREHFSTSNIRLLVAFANRLVTHVIANSQATLDAFRSVGGRTSASVCYNGFNISAFDELRHRRTSLSAELRSELDIPKGATLIGLFGRLAPWKGQHVALESIRDLADTHLVLIGEALFGEEAYKQKLLAIASSSDLVGRVHFLGFRSDVPELMQGVDIVVHCSIAPEPFGRVIVEAMLSERPVVATDGGGVREIIQNGVDGLLCPPDAPQALALALRQLTTDPVHTREMITAAKRRASSSFALPNVVKEFDRVISGVHSLKPTGVQSSVLTVIRDGHSQ